MNSITKELALISLAESGYLNECMSLQYVSNVIIRCTMSRKNDDPFNPYRNPTSIYIYHDQEKINVRISWNPGFEFIVDFIFRGQDYSLKLPPISSKEKLFSSNEIIFKGIELHLMEKEKIARRLNEVLNFNFD